MSPKIDKNVLLDIIDSLEFSNVACLAAKLSLTVPDTRKLLKIHSIILDDNTEADLCDIAEKTIFDIMHTGENSERLVAAKFVLEKLKKKYKDGDSNQKKLLDALLNNAESNKKE